MSLNKYGDIIPGKSLAGLTIGTPLLKLKDELDSYVWDNYSSNGEYNRLTSPYTVSYQLDEVLILVFNILNGKLCQISALADYEGTLFNTIRPGQEINEITQIFSTVYYDDEEDGYFFEDHKGIGIYLSEDLKSNIVTEITVFDSDLLVLM